MEAGWILSWGSGHETGSHLLYQGPQTRRYKNQAPSGAFAKAVRGAPHGLFKGSGQGVPGTGRSTFCGLCAGSGLGAFALFPQT